MGLIYLLHIATGPEVSNCPNDITVILDDGEADAIITWTEPTAQNDDGVISLDSNYSPGSVFGIGTTTIMYRAAVYNNLNVCSFDVIIIGE